MTIPALSPRPIIGITGLSGQMKMLAGMIPINRLHAVEKVLAGQVPDPARPIANDLAVKVVLPASSLGLAPQ